MQRQSREGDERCNRDNRPYHVDEFYRQHRSVKMLSTALFRPSMLICTPASFSKVVYCGLVK